MKILIKGNLTVDGYIATLTSFVEETFQAIGEKGNIDESEYDVIIEGDMSIHSFIVWSKDISVTVIGYICVF